MYAKARSRATGNIDVSWLASKRKVGLTLHHVYQALIVVFSFRLSTACASSPVVQNALLSDALHYPPPSGICRNHLSLLMQSSLTPSQKHIKDLVTLVAKHVMDNGGVVRNLDSWGTLTLPQQMKRHKVRHSIGE